MMRLCFAAVAAPLGPGLRRDDDRVSARILNTCLIAPRSRVLFNREKEVIECLIVIRRVRAGA